MNTWLAENNIDATTISRGGDWLAISVPVSKANVLFDTQMTVFHHAESDQSAIRTNSFSVPASLRDSILTVHPMTSFWNPLGHQPTFSTPLSIPKDIASRQVPASCNTTITPACLQALYGIPTTRATQSSNVLGVSGFIGQFANQADLKVSMCELLAWPPGVHTTVL